MKNQTKTCKDCGSVKDFQDFPNSALAKDGKLGYCSNCWGKKASAAGRLSYSKSSKSNKKHKKTIAKPVSKDSSVEFKAINKAIAAISEEKFLVRSSSGDLQEFNNENQALNQALLWKLKGVDVTIWRQCEFEMVMRIIG